MDDEELMNKIADNISRAIKGSDHNPIEDKSDDDVVTTLQNNVDQLIEGLVEEGYVDTDFSLTVSKDDEYTFTLTNESKRT